MTKQQHIQRGSANGYAECECAQCQTFTAGPWARSENDTFKIVNSYGSVVAECRYFGAAQRHANAKLIAAAPELLAACQEAECLFAHGVVSQCSLTETSDRNIEAAKKIMRQIQDAIAAATN